MDLLILGLICLVPCFFTAISWAFGRGQDLISVLLVSLFCLPFGLGFLYGGRRKMRKLAAIPLWRFTAMALTATCGLSAIFVLVFEHPNRPSTSMNTPRIICLEDERRLREFDIEGQESFGIATPRWIGNTLVTHRARGILRGREPETISGWLPSGSKALRGTVILQKIPTAFSWQADARASKGFFSKTQTLHIDNATDETFALVFDDQLLGSIEAKEYATVLVNPGEHRIEAKPKGSGQDALSLKIATSSTVDGMQVDNYVWNLRGLNAYECRTIEYKRE